MSVFAESHYEKALLDLLENLGYDHVYGPDVERDYRVPFYEVQLAHSLTLVNPTKPSAAIEEAIRKVRDIDSGTLVQKNEKLLAMIRHFHEQKKWIAAICMAPLILKNAGCLPEHFTAHDCVKDVLNCKSTEPAVTDEKAKIITGRGPGAAFQFAFEIMKHLVGEDAVAGCKKGIHFQ